MKYILIILAIFILPLSVAHSQDSLKIKENENQAKIYFNQGITLMKESKFNDAVAYFDSSIQKNKLPQALFYKGFAQFNLKNYEDARQNYSAAIAMNDSFDNAYSKLAFLQQLLKEYDAALATYSKLLTISKNEQLKTDAEMQIEVIKGLQATDALNKGVELAKAGKFDEAIASYESSLKIKKDYRAYYYQGAAYRSLKKYPEAISAYQLSLSLGEKPEVLKGLAGVYVEQKDYEKAIAAFEKAGAKDDIARLYVTWGAGLFKEKKYDNAIDVLTKGNTLMESDINYLLLGQAYGEKKKYAEADTAFEKALTIKKSVTPGQIAYYRGAMYKAKGDIPKATEQFKLGLADEKFKKACKSELDRIEAEQKMKNEKKK